MGVSFVVKVFFENLWNSYLLKYNISRSMDGLL